MRDAIEVPYTSLEPETLNALVAEFVTRDGTDYGTRERSLDEKIADVLRQIRRGEVKIFFDPESNGINLIPARDLRPLGPSRRSARTDD